jgi:threonine dehydrogenase-like Zn-dependent dehydrogenase
VKALCWYGKHDVRVESVPDPQILNSRDAIIRVTRSAICGSDLHLYNGFNPAKKEGDILGHEFVGEVVEVARPNGLKVGDRVLVPFAISCGRCFYCSSGLWSLCDNSNPNAWVVEKLYGFSSAGLFGYSSMFGHYAGGQAEFVRVPFSDVGPVKIPDSITDEQALFLTDIFPTGYQAAEACSIQRGDTVAVWGCGPVGQFAIKSAFLLGAERVIGLDRFPQRLRLAEKNGAQTINYMDQDVFGHLKQMTGGRGPDACIDAVGLEAHGTGVAAVYDRAKQSAYLQTDRPTVLRQAIHACRKGGTVSIPGVYTGWVDKFPIGAAFGKGLTLKMGQTHVHKYVRPLMEKIETGVIDPTFIISHRFPLESAALAYKLFHRQKDDCIKVVLDPQIGSEPALPSGDEKQRYVH